jgi:CTP:molybdopterin cytidylyltransferase MocA
VKLGAVILAAGAGRRLGGQAKALLRTATGVTFLDQIVATARVAGLADGVVVVAAPFGVEVGAAARALGLRVVENPQPERGMASSIALGFAALSAFGVDAAWLWPVDHPGVTPATLDALVASLGTHDAARPCVNDRGGHPPLVARALWARLASCAELPRGAREIFDAADVVNVAVADAGCVRDVDTASDLHEARG